MAQLSIPAIFVQLENGLTFTNLFGIVFLKLNISYSLLYTRLHIEKTFGGSENRTS